MLDLFDDSFGQGRNWFLGEVLVKCPKCGAPTEVLETRPYMGVFSRRTRLCFNEHKTSTYEVPASALDRRQLPVIKRGIKTREEARRRRLTVIRSPGVPASELASKLGITEARVRQIRKEANDRT